MERQLQMKTRVHYGIRFLKPHQIQWLTSSSTLRQQTGLSLVDRCKHFEKEFPTAHMNSALIKKIYNLHKIKKRKLQWYK